MMIWPGVPIRSAEMKIEHSVMDAVSDDNRGDDGSSWLHFERVTGSLFPCSPLLPPPPLGTPRYWEFEGEEEGGGGGAIMD